MKAILFKSPNNFEVAECPVPELGDYDILIKVGACGICGTDIHILRGEHIVKFPVIPGHEFAGEVVDIGSKVSNVKVGDRVTVDPNIVDQTCFFCRRGEIHLCENLTAIGVNFDGGFAEYCRVPALQAYKVPDGVSTEEAAMAEPIACCIHGIDRAQIKAGDRVVILGAGSVGLIMTQLARMVGAAFILVSEPNSEKRLAAARLGADALVDPAKDDVRSEVLKATTVGADVVIESAGRPETAALSWSLARRGGRVLQFGMVSPENTISIPPYDIYYKELTVCGSFVNPHTHSRAIQLLASGRIEVATLITHKYPLEEAAEAFETSLGGSAIKTLFIPS